MNRAHLFRGIGSFTKKNAVMVIAMVAALITCFLIPPDAAYLQYFDVKTLTCLFCVLAVVCALKNIRFFYIMARKIVEIFKNIRICVLALVYITFIGSMLIANDMALLTFLPLGLFVIGLAVTTTAAIRAINPIGTAIHSASIMYTVSELTREDVIPM